MLVPQAFTAVSELAYTGSTLQSGIFIKKMPPFDALKRLR
jgi:hypothetical protein